MKTILLGVMMSLTVMAAAQQTGSFSGRVTTSGNVALAGATVHVLNSNYGVSTNDNGEFTIENIPLGLYRAELTAVGYASEQHDIVIREGTTTTDFTLQEISKQLDAVVVTAEKKEEDVQSIPVSISALSSRQVEAYRIWNAQDITAIAPNVYSSNPGDNRNVTSVRGITSTSYDPAVATYIDGVNQFGLDTYIAQLFDVERIEILRGPQGTLYGRNAMGGVINIITRQPTNHTNGFVEASAGNYGQQRYSIGLKTPLIKNKLFLGLSGLFDQTTGFYTNTFDGSRFDKRHSITGNYYLKYKASSRLAFTLNVKNSNNRNNGAFPLSYLSADTPTSYTVNQDATAKMIDDVFNSSLTANYTGSRINFSSQSSYQSNYRYYNKPLDGDFSPIDGVTVINNYGRKWNNVKVLTQEFKISSPASTRIPLQWTAGTYMYYQHNPVKQATRFGKDAKYVGVEGDSLFSLINTGKGENKGIAFFGQATYTLFEKLAITAGLRYDYEHKKLGILGEYQHDPNPDPIFQTRPDTSATVSYKAFSPKFNIAYHFNNEHTLYTSYSRGFRTGGLTQLGSDPSQPPLYAYKPEYSNNVELGLKNTFFNNRVSLNLSAFYVTVNDAQVPTLDPQLLVIVTRNTGKLTSKGLEVQLAARPLKGLQVEYNVGFTNATYKTLAVGQQNDQGENVVVDLSGKKQLYTPSMTSMLAMQYDKALGTTQQFKLMARGEWMYLGTQYFDLKNDIKQSSYGILNTRFGVAYKNFDLTFWVRNINDKKYIAYAYDFGAAHLGNPRNYGATLRVRF